MDRRQNNSRRCEIVQQFLTGLTDDIERQICRLYQLGFDDGEIRRRLKLRWGRMEAIKRQLAIGLRQAGIELTEVR